MTLILDRSKGPVGQKIEAKTGNYLAPDEFLYLSAGGYINIEDACCLIEYILTNTDIMKDDPRLGLVKRIKAMRLCPGYNIESDPASRKFVVCHVPKRTKPKQKRFLSSR